YNIKLVQDYEFTDENLDKMEDYSYALQSRMKTSVEDDESTYLIIPAVYAVDNDPNNKLENFVVTRTVKSYSSATSAVTISEPFNKVAKLNVDRAGTYTVTYTIYDKEGGNKAEVSYQVVVQDNFVDDVAPIITFDTAIPTSAKAGETITFKKPTAVDYRDENKNTGDTRLNLKTYYYVDSIDDKVLINEDEKDSTKLSLTVPTDFSGSKITIISICIDDSGNVEQSSHDISIVNDTEAPVFAEIADFEAAYVQGSTISIPSVKVTDNYVNSVTASIEVTNSQGERVLVSGLTYTNTADGVTLENAKFYAVQSGEYQIRYVLRDGSDNVSIFTKTLNVTKTSTPVIKVDSDLITCELGDEVDLNIFKAYDEGRLISPNDIVISGVPVDNNNKFHAVSVGSYTATFTYNYLVDDGQQSISKDVVINVNDTTAPTITFDNGTFVDTAYKPNQEITLPIPIVTDNSGETCTLNIKITFNSEEVEYDEETKKFTPVNEGNYTITYTATDIYGNSADKEFTITVGDKTGPVVDLGDESVNAPSTMKKGSTFTLDTSKITIYDEYENENINIKDSKVTITLRDGDNKVVENTSPNGFSWNLDKVGTYTLSIIARDESGNRTTLTRSIEVNDETI
ncbi:MAG: Ig-like domain-containing protein, partial [Christensenellales bacterium]